jgi:hypothetical protein
MGPNTSLCRYTRRIALPTGIKHKNRRTNPVNLPHRDMTSPENRRVRYPASEPLRAALLRSLARTLTASGPAAAPHSSENSTRSDSKLIPKEIIINFIRRRIRGGRALRVRSTWLQLTETSAGNTGSHNKRRCDRGSPVGGNAVPQRYWMCSRSSQELAERRDQISNG